MVKLYVKKEISPAPIHSAFKGSLTGHILNDMLTFQIYDTILCPISLVVYLLSFWSYQSELQNPWALVKSFVAAYAIIGKYFSNQNCFLDTKQGYDQTHIHFLMNLQHIFLDTLNFFQTYVLIPKLTKR